MNMPTIVPRKNTTFTNAGSNVCRVMYTPESILDAISSMGEMQSNSVIARRPRARVIISLSLVR